MTEANFKESNIFRESENGLKNSVSGEIIGDSRIYSEEALSRN